MSKKAKATPAHDPNLTLKVGGAEADLPKRLAQAALRPTVQAALTIQQWTNELGETDINLLLAELGEQVSAANSGNLKRSESMLVAQAHTLDAIFHHLSRRALANMGHYPETVDLYLRLALRAQSQCRATIETHAEIKYPRPVAFVKQANIANNQQINNGAQPPSELSDTYAQARPRAGEPENRPNELLEAQHGKRLDIGTPSTASGIDTKLETVGAINRAENRSR